MQTIEVTNASGQVNFYEVPSNTLKSYLQALFARGLKKSQVRVFDAIAK